MKKILLFCLSVGFFFMGNISNAQIFTVQADTVFANVSGFSAVPDKITVGTSLAQQRIVWKVDGSKTNFPTDWKTSAALGICDNRSCYTNSNDTLINGTLFTSNYYLPGVMADFHLSLDLSAATTLGTYYLTVVMRDTASLQTKNIVFVITKSAAAVPTVSMTEDEVVTYPNPARNELNVLFSKEADVKTIAVYNLIGKVINVYKTTVDNSAMLDIRNLPSGLYFIRLMNGNGGVVATRKFTKE
jgi:hypothetical protein